MAGNYPDAPSWRMAYDRDGTQVYKISSANVITQLTSGDIIALNDESGSSVYSAVPYNGQSGSLVWFFPELRDLDAYLSIRAPGSYSPSSFSVSVSTDTTNGLDGTWTQISTAIPPAAEVKPLYRTGIVSTTSLGIRAVKMTAGATSNNEWLSSTVHLYGEPAPGENPNRLALWHPTLDQRVGPAYFDWGNVPRSSSADLLFRVKNLSASLTANSIRVAMEAATDTTPSVPAQHTLSHAGGSFLAQVNIGTLAPGAISSAVTLRRITPSNAILSLWSFRVFAESTTGWT
jgi:hypothetical protein